MKLSEFLQDNSGGLSSMRLVFLVWTLGIFSIWAYASVSTRTLVPIPESVIVMFSAICTAKSVQRIGEKAEPAATPAPQ